MEKRKLQNWIIECHDGNEVKCRKIVKLGCFSEPQLKRLLQTLAAQYLSNDKIIGALAKRRTKNANDLLVVSKERSLPMYTCGENPFFTARIEGFDYANAGRRIARLAGLENWKMEPDY